MSTRLAAVTRPLRATGVPPRRLAVSLAGLLGVEALLLGAWLWLTPGGVTAPRYLLYPFVWIDASLLAAAVVLLTAVYGAFALSGHYESRTQPTTLDALTFVILLLTAPLIPVFMALIGMAAGAVAGTASVPSAVAPVRAQA